MIALPMHKLRRMRPTIHCRQGAIVVLSAVLMIVMLGFVAFTVDVGAICFKRAELQNAADAAAMAAVKELGGTADIATVARSVAELNERGGSGLTVGANTSTVLDSADVEPGVWDKTSRSFSKVLDVSIANSVRVTTRRSASGGNAQPLFFAPVLGQGKSVDLKAVAIALLEPGTVDCYGSGWICGNKLQIGDNCTLSGVCAYGRLRVELGGGCKVINGAKVGSLPSSVVQYSSATGLPANLQRLDKQPTLANTVVTLINNIQSGVNLPSQITRVVVLSSWPPATLQTNTAYIVNKSVSIPQNQTRNFKNVIIACRGTIAIGQNATLNNTGVSVDLNTALIATGDIQIGQQSSVKGVDMIAGHDVQIGQELRALEVGVCQAVHDIQLGQGPTISPRKPAYVEQSSPGAVALVQ